ncbi:MAG: CRISPR-associated protein [Cyanobacteria bacterium J06627_28]
MQRNSLIEAITDPSKNFLAFLLIGIFGLGIISSGISNLLLETLGSWLQKNYGINKVIFQLGIISLIGLIILFSVYFTNLARRLKAVLGYEEIQVTSVVALTNTFSGLIAIPSLGRHGKVTPAEIAIRHHWQQGRGRLRYCWLICTPDALSATQQFLEQLKQECLAQKIPFHTYNTPEQSFPPAAKIAASLHVRLVMIEPKWVHDPNHIRQLVDQLYSEAKQQAGLTSEHIIADYTGGTKSMTAGMVLACSEPERELQYWASQYGNDGEIVESQLMKVTLAYRIKAVSP